MIKGVLNLNLNKLNAYNNSKIKDVNHMTKLKNLDAHQNYVIGDNGIKY